MLPIFRRQIVMSLTILPKKGTDTVLFVQIYSIKKAFTCLQELFLLECTCSLSLGCSSSVHLILSFRIIHRCYISKEVQECFAVHSFVFPPRLFFKGLPRDLGTNTHPIIFSPPEHSEQLTLRRITYKILPTRGTPCL